MTDQRQWTLDAAREMMKEVRARTERAVEEVERLIGERDASERDSKKHAALEAGIGQAVQRWAREMEALGADVKGPWLVDFDTGGGYYCWKWPEESLEYFHGYEEGFAGRVRIQ